MNQGLLTGGETAAMQQLLDALKNQKTATLCHSPESQAA